MKSPVEHPAIVHASCVAFGASAVLIMGASGTGKSAISLQLMAYGARLVADDQTILTPGPQGLSVCCPKPLSGKIEARGIGLLAADFQIGAQLRLVVDLDQKETDRLPPAREIDLHGHRLALLYAVDGPHFPAAILQLLKGGRNA